MATLLGGFLRQGEPAEAAELSRLGPLATTRRGAIPALPSRRAVEDLLCAQGR